MVIRGDLETRKLQLAGAVLNRLGVSLGLEELKAHVLSGAESG